MGEEEPGEFIPGLAKIKKISASPQNQALWAIIFYIRMYQIKN